VIRRACLFFVLFLAASAGVGGAHAYIVGTQPAMNGSYASLGGSVAVSFDEPVTLLNSDALEVLDDTGRRIDRRNAHIDPNDATRVVVQVPQGLAAGIYTVRWRVISADTHVVHGTYQLGVGGLQLNAIVRDRTLSPFDPAMPLASLLRWLSLLGAILAVGAFALQRLVLRFVNSADAEHIARSAALAGAALVLIVAIPALVVQAAAVSGNLGSAIPQTLTDSRWGIALIFRFASAAALLLVATFAWRRGAIAGGLAAAVLLGSFSASGHAVSLHAYAGVVAVLMDFAHLVSAAIWVGGVFVLVPIVITNRDLTLALFARFTPLAMFSVAVILVSGIYATIVHVPSFSDFVRTLYGRILLVKIALVAVLLAFGYRHWQIGRGRGAASASNTLGWEAVVGVAVIALTAVLVGQMLPMHMIMER
jgi:copper transport protein